ncbi:flagella synthesis protein FlgN [Methylophaga sulfidovorans]|uniref:Flagella synthesis protein FlgN n=1 Tax=Methylophaga sulfidovorans TaxID=45496 RepID=A0A1I3U3A5_9GAMM|nr:flagellar protein FlgN [Methylophaga sulfidovorans]SFJ77470.1 flagella synthesis protein FlgN [Methylophaga sulfidovorans]
MSMNAMQQLSTILQSEISNSTALATLLKQERDALKISDVDKVSEITKLKQPYLLKLEQLARQREQLLTAVGFPAGKSGLEAFIANQEEAEATHMSMQVTRLREVAKTCREFNQINGGIINVNRQYLVRALSILRGRDPETGAYGPGGEYTSQVVRQPLIGRV